MLILFVNTLTANDKYSRSIMQNSPRQFQTSLSQKEKTFYVFLFEFLKWAWNLEHFFKKDEYLKLIISEIIDSERRGRLKI